MIENAILDRATFFALGCVVGWLLGRITRLSREARDNSKKAVEMLGDMKNDDGALRDNIALIAVLLLTAFSAILSGVSVSKIADAQAHNDETQAALVSTRSCTESVLRQTINALNQRTAYSTEINVADLRRVQADAEKDKAFAKLITASLAKPPVGESKARKIVQAYGEKLDESIATKDRYIELVQAKDKKAEQYPYPTLDDYRSCLNRPSR